jgi:hypothetical protein
MKTGIIFISILFLTVIYFNKEERTHTSMFCAYGMLFVEFEDSKSKWGTVMLDPGGRPVSCDNEKKTIEHTVV